MIRKLRTRACVPVLLLLGAAAVCVAQDLAITRASVYSSPEAQVRSDVTIVIRHGVIAEVGEHLRVPKVSRRSPARAVLLLRASGMRMCILWSRSGAMPRISPRRN